VDAAPIQVRDLLLRRLSDGRFHSGQRLAQTLGVTRTAVWKQIQRLESEYGLAISAVRGRGYRLVEPLELLDAGCIRDEFSATAHACLESMQLYASTASTNACAAADLPTAQGTARVWLAEHQTAGRGRRGRQWFSAFGQNINLSIAWRFELPMSDLAGLSLVAGVVVAEVLEQMGLHSHCLKWPNDVLVEGRKLAGILVEASGEADGPSTAIVGIGVNFHLPQRRAGSIDQPWIDLRQASPLAISRNRMAGALVDQLIHAFKLFAAEQLAPFLDRWRRFDGLSGKDVQVMRGDQAVSGIYRGVAASGAMILEDGSGHSEHHAGEVSLRRLGGA
jgi:BirA family biotin operon repressor/biotin-[acetyl-CoA-carboxylase] ligase